MGTWPGSPPDDKRKQLLEKLKRSGHLDMAPKEEPNWRSMYYAEKESHTETRRQIARLKQAVRDLEEDMRIRDEEEYGVRF